MGEAIIVKVIPGCPARVIAETEEEREVIEATLANLECGCVVEAEAAKAALAEAEELVAEGKEEEALEVAEEALATLEGAEEAKEAPVCSLEPDKPWEESVCGIVAAEAGEIAAGKVMARLREEGLIA